MTDRMKNVEGERINTWSEGMEQRHLELVVVVSGYRGSGDGQW